MRRFEFSEGSSNKFWEIERQGTAFAVRFGRIGTQGQIQQKSFSSDSKAQAEFDKLVSEKLKKGYVEVDGSATQTLAAAVATAPAAPSMAEPRGEPESTTAATAVPVQVQAPAPSESSAAALPTEDPRPIAWDDSLLKRVFPRRGGVAVPVRPLSSPRKAWAGVREAWRQFYALVEGGRKDARELSDELDRVITRVGSEEPSIGSVVEDAILLALLHHKGNRQDRPKVQPMVDVLLALGGPAHATQVVLKALEFHVERDGSEWAAIGAYRIRRGKEPRRINRFSRGNIDAAARLRELLATRVDDAGYIDARNAAAQLKPRSRDQRLARAFLFPTESLWTEAELATEENHVLLTAISSRAVLEKFLPNIGVSGLQPYIASAMDGLGVEAFALVRHLLDSMATPQGWTGSAELKLLCADALARINSDEAQQTLFESLDKDSLPFALEAAARWPRRALRMLGRVAADRGKQREPARTALEHLVRRMPAVVEAELSSLPDDALKPVLALLQRSGPDVPEAAPDRLPSILVQPPWVSSRKPAAPPVVEGFTTPVIADDVVWRPGEREAWSRGHGWEYWTAYSNWTDEDWKSYRADPAEHPANACFFVHAPVDVIASRLADYRLDCADENWIPKVAARLELVGLSVVERYVTRRGAEAYESLAPFAVSRLAPDIAAAFVGARKARPHARAWLLRHPRHAAAGLLEPALGRPGKAKDAAAAALRFLTQNGREQAVFDVAKSTTPPVDQALRELIDFDPLLRFPARAPKLPSFVIPEALPRPLLADRTAKLPAAALDTICTMLAFSDPDDPYAGLALVKEACDPRSLAQMAWSLFESWLIAGAPSKDGWAFRALGVFGDDECARRLAALIRQWPGEAAHARAVSGLEILAAIGTDVTLTYLNGISEKVKFKGLQEKAREKISQIAEVRGLTRDELADRLVPDLGLDPDGSLQLEFGERRFTVGFDEQFKPFVKDVDGARLKDLPKPTKKDDPEKAKAAVERWKALKRDAKQVGTLQVLRMELAMCGRRRWAAPLFRQFFVDHPLLIHIVRRLVWATYDAEGRITATFRVAEDRSFADRNEDTWMLTEDAQVGLPHALELDAETAGAWGEIFADYEILQPFPQLGRPTWKATPEELSGTEFVRAEGLKVPTGKVLGLEARGWRRGTPLDGGVAHCMEKHLGDGRLIELELDPGLFTGMLSEAPEQTLGTVSIRHPGSWGNDGQYPLSDLGPIQFSELVRDLEGLRS